MKTISLVPACLAATLFLLPAVQAEEPTGAGAPPDRRQEMLKRFDKNGNGKLDDDEKAEMRAQHERRRERMHGRLLKRFDQDKDGKLNDAELTQMVNSLQTRPRVIKRFDQDGDGKLNAEEKAVADRTLRERWSDHDDES